MKTFATILAYLAAVSAQSVSIGAPPPQATLTAGQDTVVAVFRPNFQSSAQEVAVVIGISSCTADFCPSPADTMGRILYSGSYNPQINLSVPFEQPVQNFTVEVPANMPQGPAILGVAHMSLIGASLTPTLETKNVTVVIN